MSRSAVSSTRPSERAVSAPLDATLLVAVALVSGRNGDADGLAGTAVVTVELGDALGTTVGAAAKTQPAGGGVMTLLSSVSAAFMARARQPVDGPHTPVVAQGLTGFVGSA